MKKIALYPGSFDPLTIGHVDVVERSLSVFDEIVILVASSSRKQALLQPEVRVELIREVFKKNPKVSVQAWDGLMMDYARKVKAHAVIRGLRAASDFEYEFMMAAMNKDLYADVETFFIMTGQNLYFISSTMIKELFLFKGDISRYVPKEISEYLNKNFKDWPKK